MSDYRNNKYKFRISRSYHKVVIGRRRSRRLTILTTGFAGAVIGGLLSAAVVITVCTNSVQSKPTLAPVLGQKVPGSNNTDYSTGSYPVVSIAKKVCPAVVIISNFQSVNSQGLSQELGNNLIEIGSGSGFIIDSSKGYIVTNYHVIKGAQKLLVHLADGKNIYAEVVGADSRADLAVIKISDTRNLSEVVLGDSTKLQVGEPVVVIGNPGGEEFSGSVTAGVVSATNRILQGESCFNLIQTDAAINPGNSGGPLVNYQGQVIGINSAKFQQTGIEGIGFAIPIKDALPTIQQLIKNCYGCDMKDCLTNH